MIDMRLVLIALLTLMVTINSSAIPYVLVKARASQVGILEMIIPYGSRDAPSGSEGLSHLIEHLLFRGKGCRNEFKLELDEIGAQYNAVTRWEWTTFTFVVPSENFKELTETIICKLKDPTVSPEEFLVERRVLINEMRMRRALPSGRLHDIIAKRLGFPWREGGTPESLSHITYEEAMTHLRSRLSEAVMLSNLPPQSSLLELTPLKDMKRCQQMSWRPSSVQAGVVKLSYPESGLIIAYRVPGIAEDPSLAVALDVIGLAVAHADSPLRRVKGVKDISIDYPTRCGPSIFVVSIRGDVDKELILRNYQELLSTISSSPRKLKLITEVTGYLMGRELLKRDNPITAVDSLSYWIGLGAPEMSQRYREMLKNLDGQLSRAAEYLLRSERLIVSLEE